MRCPFCLHDETKVIDSRTSPDFSIRRRRECLSCERRFTTYERIEESPIKVIKKDGSRVTFDREKIRSGVEKACYKRPISAEQIDQLVGEVEATIYEDGMREVQSVALENSCSTLFEISTKSRSCDLHPCIVSFRMFTILWMSCSRSWRIAGGTSEVWKEPS